MQEKSLIQDMVDKVKTHQKLLIWFIFITYLFLGIFIYKDYGMSWDEPFSHQNGKVSLDYVLNGDQTLFSYSERHYGVSFEMFLAFFDRVIQYSSSQEVYFLRHLLTFLVFFCSVFVFYLLCRKRFKNIWFALLGPLFLILTPRIFAESFYNSKDIPFLAFFIISIFTLILFTEKPSIRNAVLHGLSTAFLVGIRLPGLFIPVLTLVIFSFDLFFLNNTDTWKPSFQVLLKQRIKLFLVYFISLIGFLLLFWPFLWQNPVGNFIEAFGIMNHWTREAGTELFYFGKFIFASILPWHYLPVWIGITTPVLYLTLFFVGVFVSLKKITEKGLDYYRYFKLDFIALCWFFGPLLLVIFMKSILYDGWRHLYFVYPALIFLSLVGLENVILFLKNRFNFSQKYISLLLGVVLSVNFIAVSSFMVRNHPYQNLYFNFLVGNMENARKNFDLDYWGLTFREGLEYIAKEDSDPEIRIFFQYSHPDNIDILAPEIKSRFVLVDSPAGAKYIISNYRWQIYNQLPFNNEFYTIKVDGVGVMTVFKQYDNKKS